ncbi:hypothetical protein BA766_19255 [Stenotrophomonas maltophilia]|nr:hypothetical protein BA766_19255 [Stenotrophomonas maltophilia]
MKVIVDQLEVIHRENFCESVKVTSLPRLIAPEPHKSDWRRFGLGRSNNERFQVQKLQITIRLTRRMFQHLIEGAFNDHALENLVLVPLQDFVC